MARNQLDNPNEKANKHKDKNNSVGEEQLGNSESGENQNADAVSIINEPSDGKQSGNLKNEKLKVVFKCLFCI